MSPVSKSAADLHSSKHFNRCAQSAPRSHQCTTQHKQTQPVCGVDCESSQKTARSDFDPNVTTCTFRRTQRLVRLSTSQSLLRAKTKRLLARSTVTVF